MVGAMKAHPNAARLQIEMARVELVLGEAADAMKVIDAIEPGTVHPTQLNLLRGKALSGQGKWAEAADLLLKATRLNPEPAEAWYELGRVYEHNTDWANAAAAYRHAFETTGD